MIRDSRFDFAKGVLIVLVVFAHLPRMGSCANELETLVSWIYTFHMPVFVLITGYFFGKKTGTLGEAKTVASRMFRPFFTMAIVSSALYVVAAKLGVQTSADVPVNDLPQLTKNILLGAGGGALWYLYTCGVFQLLTLIGLYVSSKCRVRTAWFNLAICVAIAWTGSFVLHKIGFRVNAIMVPYFIIGFAFRRSDFKMPSNLLFGLIAAIVVIVADVHIGCVANYVWIVAIFFTLLGLGQLADAKLPRFSNALCYLGKHTLAILIFHNILSVGLRPLSSLVLNIEPTGIVLQLSMTAVLITLSIGLEWAIKKTPAQILIFEKEKAK